MNKTIIIGAIIIFDCSSIASAYSVSLIIITFGTKGAESKKTISIINDSDEPMAVKISIGSRNINEDGSEFIKETDEIEKSFSIYPAQAVIRENSTRSIVVQYLGDSNINIENAYRLIVNQVDINFDRPTPKGSKGGMEFFVEYSGLLYVRPSGTTPDLQVKSVSRVNIDGKDNLIVAILNKGAAHDVIYAPQLKKGNDIILDSNQLLSMMEANILFGNTRRFVILWPKGKILDQLQNLRLS